MQLKPEIMNEILVYKTAKGEVVDLKSKGFELILQDPHSFLFWLGDESIQNTINSVFDEQLKKVWTAMQITERRATVETTKHIETRRTARISRHERKATTDVSNQQKMEVFRDKQLRNLIKQEGEVLRQRRQTENDRIQYVSKLWDTIKDSLTRERAVWGPANLHPLEKWQLDRTEGPYRMRKKMERNKDFYVRYPYYEPEYMDDITKKQGIPPPTSEDSDAYYRLILSEGKSTKDYYVERPPAIESELVSTPTAVSPNRSITPLPEGLDLLPDRSGITDTMCIKLILFQTLISSPQTILFISSKTSHPKMQELP